MATSGGVWVASGVNDKVDQEALRINTDSALVMLGSTLLSAGVASLYIPSGMTRIRRSKIVNTHEAGIALQNEGRLVIHDSVIEAKAYGLKSKEGHAHFYRSQITANAVGIFLEGVSSLLLSDTKVKAAHSLYSAFDIAIHCCKEELDGITNIQHKEQVTADYLTWPGFLKREWNSLVIDVSAIPHNIIGLIDHADTYTASLALVSAALELTAPDLAYQYQSANDDAQLLITLKNADEFPASVLETIYELLTDADEAQYALDTITILSRVNSELKKVSEER